MMNSSNNTQVQLSNSKVRILSLPREDYWLFSSGILKLLNQSIFTHNGSDTASEGDHDDDDSDNEDQYGRYDTDADSDNSSLSDWSASSKQQPQLKLKKKNSDAGPMSSSNLISSINDLRIKDDQANDEDFTDEQEEDEQFYHIAFTKNECTLIFSECFMGFFEEAVELSLKLGKDIKLFPDSFYLLEIAGDGLNIGKRVVQITEPLYQGDVSLFFLSNYFSDVVLVPDFAREKVITLLESENFQFSNYIKSYNASLEVKDVVQKKVGEDDIFTIYEKEMKPRLSASTKLLLTGARSNDNRLVIEKTILSLSCNPPGLNTVDEFPKIFSITKTLQDEVALLLPKNYEKFFAFDKRNLVGSLDEVMIPITIDLSKLPLDIKGVVNGVAKKLINRFDSLEKGENCELCYLSMARSAIVMIPIENVHDVNGVF